ncbi:hypothetical protein L873DRAFT_1805114 [Choiromyces venosus 120613-1]|uniref:C2H2-type domain-containing protein n=1 Tax=Choiromyces venosus 120613-1 TaxID=1336337 RepID=A0A3N4JQB0_9PEZI|nr:hypothetical protein L873DRAFT_1805114 [Choiromyces venosus 120613-1]
MSHNFREGISGHYIPNDTLLSPKNENTIPDYTTLSTNLSELLPDHAPIHVSPSSLSCPVSGCSKTFEGDKSHECLLRHLKRPRNFKSSGYDEAVWHAHHKEEHRRRVSIRRINPNSKLLRITEFEVRAKNMGITEQELIEEKIKIWEGMWDAKDKGDSIAVGLWLIKKVQCLGSYGCLYQPVEACSNSLGTH